MSRSQEPPGPATDRERRDAALPDEIELCANCRAGLIFYIAAGRGGETIPYCPKCGTRRPGVRYVKGDVGR